MRERLIELLKEADEYASGVCTDYEEAQEVCADYLLAEGVVKVVRCKDCKYGTLCYGEIKCTVDEDDCGLILYHEPQHFCSYGERKEE